MILIEKEFQSKENIPFILLEISNISKIHVEEHANELGEEEDALIVLTEEKSNPGSTEKKAEQKLRVDL
jgi:hypothetical protein